MNAGTRRTRSRGAGWLPSLSSLLAVLAATLFVPLSAAADPETDASVKNAGRPAVKDVCAFYEARAWADHERGLRTIRVDLWQLCERASDLLEDTARGPAVAGAAAEMMAALDTARLRLIDAVMASWIPASGDVSAPPGALWRALDADGYVRAERIWINTLRAEGLDPFASPAPR